MWRSGNWISQLCGCPRSALPNIAMGRPLWSVVLREKEKAKREKEKWLAIPPPDGECVERAWSSVDTMGIGLWGSSDPRLWPSGRREDSGGGGRDVNNLRGAQSDSGWAWIGDNESDSSDAAPPLEAPTTIERSGLDDGM